MKKLKFLLSFVILLAACQLSSCGKGGNSPVDQYVEILDNATKQAEKINSMSDLMNVQQIISPEDAMEIVRNNADYKLSDSDKDKLKKSYDKLVRVAYDKTAEYSGLPEEMKDQLKGQVELVIEAANKAIDAAQTMGELNGMR